MELGQPVTWDNPDVAIFLNGVEQYTYDLQVATEYTLEITLHNSSRQKPAVGTQVEVRWIDFGAGGQVRHPITSLVADVPVWPGSKKVTTIWRSPASPGHYCIEVELQHPDDGNPSNNLGWNNTQVKAAASAVELPVRIFNRLPGGPPQSRDQKQQRRGRRTPDEKIHRTDTSWNVVELAVDSYVFHDAMGKEAIPKEMFDPQPPAWPARLEPALFHFREDETYRDVTLTVDAPDKRGAPEVFNVNAWQGGIPLGGVTVTLTRGEPR